MYICACNSPNIIVNNSVYIYSNSMITQHLRLSGYKTYIKFRYSNPFLLQVSPLSYLCLINGFTHLDPDQLGEFITI